MRRSISRRLKKVLQTLGPERVLRNAFAGKILDSCDPVLRKIAPGLARSISGVRNYYGADVPPEACHLKRLFIMHDGSVYPCCMRRGSDYHRIGHVGDPDILSKIMELEKYCVCSQNKLVKARPGQDMSGALLNIEVSLACQGNCAMCCVRAPEWHGNYEQYDAIGGLIESCSPAGILVQGGEVLIQKKTIEWIADLKARHPALKISLVTNGNVDLNMIEKVREIFDSVTVSIVGFEPETYRKIMGMELAKTRAFAEALVRTTEVEVTLKYLTTPINIHETSVFLEWALGLAPGSVVIEDAGSLNYIIPDTSDRYWDKIVERTLRDVESVLARNKDSMLQRATKVALDAEARKLFAIDDGWISSNGLQGIVTWR